MLGCRWTLGGVSADAALPSVVAFPQGSQKSERAALSVVGLLREPRFPAMIFKVESAVNIAQNEHLHRVQGAEQHAVRPLSLRAVLQSALPGVPLEGRPQPSLQGAGQHAEAR